MTRYLSVAAVVLVGMALTFLGLRYEQSRAQEHFQRQLERLAESEAARFQRGLDRALEVVDGLGSFLSASIRVDRDEFAVYVQHALRTHPEIRALQWLPRVTADERAGFEAELDRARPGLRISEADASGRLAPAMSREEYFPIHYVEPLAGNQAALGLDAASRPTSRQAMEQARDSGAIVVSGGIRLVQGGNGQAVVIYRPVYRGGVALHGVGQRRAQLLGFSVAVILPGRVYDAALRDSPASSLDSYLLDQSAAEGAQLLHAQASRSHRPGEQPPSLREAMSGAHWLVPIRAPGRQWVMLFSPAPALHKEFTQPRPSLALWIGALLTSLLALYQWRRIRYDEQLAEAHQALAERTRRLDEAQTLAHVGSWELDLTTKRLSWSEEVFRIFGLDPRRQSPSYQAFLELVHPEDRERVEQAYAASLANHAPYQITHRLLLPDGRVKHVLERGESHYDASGHALRSIGTVQDITEQKQAEERLRLMDYAMASAMTAVAMSDAEGRLTYVNDAFLRLWELPERAAVIGSSALDYWASPESAREVINRLGRDLHWSGELEARTATGTPFTVRCDASLVRDEGGRPLCMMATFLDLTERKRAEADLRLAASVFANTHEGVIITDAEGRILDVNQAFTDITGYPRGEVIGRNPRLWKSQHHDAAFYAALWEALNRGGSWQGEIWNRRRNGEAFPVLQTISAVRDANGALTHYVSVFSDISGIKDTQAQLAYLAQHDPLTDLPNRLLYHDRLDQALRRAEREGQSLAVLFMDLDRFKHINDSLGHAVGDQLLQEVASRLRQALRKEDTVARMGGDEFIILVEHLHGEQDAAQLAGKLLQTLASPYMIGGHELYITTSIGISLYPHDGISAEALVSNADAAMYRAKHEGRDTYQFYTQTLTAAALERVHLEAELRRAIEAEELSVHYQPQVDLATGRLVGAEALVRWRHRDWGDIPPDRFLPTAIDTGLILPLGEWVLRQACRQAKAWRDAGLTLENIAVNVAGPQILRSDFVATVRRALADSGLAAEHLELEVTEGFIMDQSGKAVAVLEELGRMGVDLSIDDFGTGYSSLAYLKRLPIDTLKVDRSFVRDLPGDEEDAAIAGAVVALGHSLGLRVIAEGVETPEQAVFLLGLGCDEAQGYFYGRPMPAAEFAAAVAERISA